MKRRKRCTGELWRALEGYEKVLGAEHSHTLNSIGHLGLMLETRRKYEESEAVHRRALEGCGGTFSTFGK